MMRDLVTCTQCGGQREHDLRTGEVGSCDTCEVLAEFERLYRDDN